MKHLFRLPAFYLLLFLGLSASPEACAQAPTWQSLLTATQASGNASAVTATAADALGNVYLVGTFQGSVSFGSIGLTSPSAGACFLAKWTPGVGFRWVRQLNGPTVTQVVVAGAVVYIAGSYAGSAAFDAVSITSAGGADGYVARLTDAGNTASFTWATSIGGTGNEDLYDMDVSGTALFVVGEFASPTLTVGASTLTNAGTSNGDAFVVKLTDSGSSGALAWAQRAGGTSRDVASSVTVRGTSVYIGGSFYSATAGFGNTTLLNTSTIGGAMSDAFIAKLTDNGATSGSFLWVQRLSGSLYEEVTDLDSNGNSVYATGRFNSPTASIGPINLPNASSSFDTFIIKLTDNGSTGTVTWAYRAGGTGHDAPWALAVSGPSIYVAGRFYGAPAGFGSTILTNASASSTYDVFVTKLLDAGSSASFSWAQRAGGLHDDEASSLTLQGSNLYVGGVLTPATTFGSQTITVPTGTRVAFLASLTDLALATTPPAWTASLQVYPNPAHSTVTLRLPALVGVSSATLTLLDALGRVVYTHPLTILAGGVHQEVRLKSVASGLYTLRVQAGQASAVRQFLVE